MSAIKRAAAPLLVLSALAGTVPSSAEQAETRPVSSWSESAGEVIAFVGALQEGEAALARAARQGVCSPQLNYYLAQVLDQCGATARRCDRLRLRLLVEPTECEISREVRARGKARLCALPKVCGPAFERAYLECQITAHQEALAAVDCLVLGRERANPVRVELELLRKTLAARVVLAQRLLVSVSTADASVW